MKNIKEKLIYIVLIYINFNLIFRLLEKGINIENFNYGFLSLLFIVGLLIYWVYHYIFRKMIYKLLFTATIFSIVGIYYFKNIEFLSGLIRDFFKSVIVLNDIIYVGSITYFYQYKMILILIIPLITCLTLWITFKFIKKVILMLTLAVVIGLWFSRSYTVVQDYLFIYIFVSLMTFIIIDYIKRIKSYERDGVKVSLKTTYILIYAVIVSLIISKVTIMLPQDYKGVDLTYFGNYFDNKFTPGSSETSSVNKDRYKLSASGYSGNDKRLGGPVSLNYQEAFKVKSYKPYYLKGNVMDLYDGNKWAKANENYYKKLSAGDMKYVNFGQNKMKTKNSLIIYPNKKFKTNTIFVPNFAFDVSNVEGKIFYDKTPIILSEKVLQKPYDVEYYEYSKVIDTIENVRDYSREISENIELMEIESQMPMEYVIKPTYKDINTFTNKEDSIENRYSYSNAEDFKVMKNYSEYLQVPENISKRIYDLVQEITKKSLTSTEKVLQIKKYLTNNYKYDLQVSVIPEGAEFIDYFLFEEKKGYCTYFNTTMTIMCRIAGVPARYVEGFKTPSEKDSDGLYSVFNSDAHAWGEVLLGATQYSNMWTIVDASPTASEDVAMQLKAIKDAQRNGGTVPQVDINSTREIPDETQNIDSAKLKETSKFKVLSDKKLRVANGSTAILLFILMRIIIVMKRKSKLLKSNGTTTIYNYYLDRLAVIRIVKPEHRSDLEFAMEVINSDLKERMLILVRKSYEEFYGKGTVQRLNVKEYYEFLEDYLNKYQGNIAYLLNKYLGITK